MLFPRRPDLVRTALSLCTLLWCSVILALVNADEPFLPPSPSPPPPSWSESIFWRKELPFGLEPSAVSTISQLWNYRFVIPRRYLGPSISFYGSATRLRRFVSDLANGTRPLKVGIVGGSIAVGWAAPWNQGFFHMFCKWLRSVSKKPISCRNGAMPATPTFYMVLCHKYSVDPDVDLVLVEYIMNDGLSNVVSGNSVPLATERLVRVLLDLPNRPAVVLVQSPRFEYTRIRSYYDTTEHLGGVNAVYYEVPTVSPHTAIAATMDVYPQPGFDFNSTVHGNHPSEFGHMIYTDVIVHLVQHTALDLAHRPLSEAERQDVARPLIEPIIPGNVPPATSSCMVGEDFHHLVVSASGFNWVDEGKPGSPKWGYVANTTGSALVFQMDTVRANLAPDAPVSVFVYFLASYSDDMGTALLECVRGCACKPTEVDSHIREHVSQTYMASFVVTQSPACQVRATVLNKTSTLGHKFKVSGVVITEQLATTGVFTAGNPGFVFLGYQIGRR